MGSNLFTRLRFFRLHLYPLPGSYPHRANPFIVLVLFKPGDTDRTRRSAYRDSGRCHRRCRDATYNSGTFSEGERQEVFRRDFDNCRNILFGLSVAAIR